MDPRVEGKGNAMKNKAMKNLVLAPSALFLAAAAAAPAHAHHAMGGELPTTWAQGVLSGVAHPVIGLDHLAFLLAAGLIAGVAGLGAAAPLLFVAASLVGVALHVMLVDIPAAEFAIALSVVVVGAGLAWAVVARNPRIWLAVFAVAGLFHGYAYGESIVGAEQTALAAYVIGLGLVQSALVLAAWWVASSRAWGSEALQPRLAGAAALGVGVSALAGQILG